MSVRDFILGLLAFNALKSIFGFGKKEVPKPDTTTDFPAVDGNRHDDIESTVFGCDIDEGFDDAADDVFFDDYRWDDAGDDDF